MMTSSIRLKIVRRGSSSHEALTRSHEHQTRNKYILLCPFRYFSLVSSKLSRLQQQPFSTNQYTRVGVLHNTPHSTTSRISIHQSTFSNLIRSHLYLIQSCRRYRSQLRLSCIATPQLFLQKAIGKVPLSRSFNTPPPLTASLKVKRSAFIQQPHFSRNPTTHSNHRSDFFSTKQASALELAFLCQATPTFCNRPS